ncbi:LuxR C-terminal-related transcriptional regulator [Prescottella sp. R16]|uniref:ATP-binding protein n=1 Tax=Prescottella sp. R16 TaxID=3064529 RepID=UPI00272DEADD|nr:LuxR C-terminal-related transcriptional regulator [Prescottella sp. R16]
MSRAVRSSTRGSAGNLPSALTTFVGRRRESTAAKRQLVQSRLVTSTGIGGVGKTRLALHVAHEVAREFPDGVWFVELAELHDPELVPDTVASVFGLQEQSTGSPTDLLVEHLAGRTALLVLDNCEHLVDSVAKLVDVLLRDCPMLRILATSRESLGVGGESVLRVGPLPVPDPESPPALSVLPRYESVTLFVERAQAAVPEFAVTEDNRVAVVQICHRLDGLPLPIELAAARVRVLSPQQILERLTDRYRLLTAGMRGAPTRQQTLRLSIDWSYDLCTPVERDLWSRLSVFAGGFGIDAVRGVCSHAAASPEAVDLVMSLVDKSILTVEGTGEGSRYGMLETLRDYGREKLEESGELDECRRRHRDWYLRVAEYAYDSWVGPRQVELIDRLARDGSNLREALDYCVSDGTRGLRMLRALFPLWFCRGMLTEGRRWYRRVLGAEDREQSTPVLVAVLGAAAQLAAMQEDFTAGAAFVRRAEQLAEASGNRTVAASARHAAGRLRLYRGDLEPAVADLRSVLPVLRSAADLYQLIRALEALGLAGGMIGDLALARACHEEVLELTRERGEHQFRAQAMYLLGLSLWREGERARAVRLFTDALPLSWSVDDHFIGAGCLESLAWAAADARQGERGAILSGAAHALRSEMGVPPVLIPTMLAYPEECRRQCRRLLGDRAFDAAFERGGDFRFADAVDFALGRAEFGHRGTAALTRREMGAPTAPLRIVVPSDTTPALTRREQQVADLVAQGMTNREIAETLVISPRTAEGHVERVLAKLGFGSRTQIAAWVAERGNEQAT